MAVGLGLDTPLGSKAEIRFGRRLQNLFCLSASLFRQNNSVESLFKNRLVKFALLVISRFSQILLHAFWILT